MKRLMQWVMAAILISGASVFTACNSSDDNPVVSGDKLVVKLVGLWECEGITGGETYNDANGRLEFFDDGTYNFYRLNKNGNWETIRTREYQKYAINGNQVTTRWKDLDEDELTESWEVKSISGDEMVWTAQRQNTDGTSFQQEVTWKRIDLKIAENIIGKWITATDVEGKPALTDSKEVITFVSATKAYASRSIGKKNGMPIEGPTPQDMPEGGPAAPGWDNNMEYDVTIKGITVTLTSEGPDGMKFSTKFVIHAISETDFSCEVIRDAPGSSEMAPPPSEEPQGEEMIMVNQRYEKITADYSETILGLWECTELTGIETYNTADARLEFYADDTYKYWRKNDAGEWETVTTREFQQYFVDGSLLCTRWKNVDEDELREWWEIASIEGDKMVWTALRLKDDGTTVQQVMKWSKIENE